MIASDQTANQNFFKDENVSDVTCMCQTDIGKDNDLIFGFENGDVFYCSEAKSRLYGNVQNKPKNIFTYGEKKKNEGRVTSVIYSEKFFAWSTKETIKVKHFPNGLDDKGDSICQLVLPLTDLE